MYTSQHGLVYKTISVTSTNKPSLYLIEKVLGFQSIHIFLKNVLSIYSTGVQNKSQNNRKRCVCEIFKHCHLHFFPQEYFFFPCLQQTPQASLMSLSLAKIVHVDLPVCHV